MSDAINKPAHYNQGSIECIEAMEIVLTPEEFRGFLKGNAIKYLWREENKGGIEDLRKAKWYIDRLIEHCDLRESLLDISKGLVKAWTCQNGKAKQVYPEQPKTPLNSDTIPEGYRKLNDSSEEPRQLGDLRWSVSEKRYVEISVDEIGYANRDNWAACRKVITEVTVEVTGEVKNPLGCPEGWRFLEVGEVIRKGDRYFDGNQWRDRDWAVKETYSLRHQKTIRRNRFEVGEKVIGVLDGFEFVVVGKHSRFNDVYVVRNKITGTIHNILDRLLTPYIEDAK